MVFENFGQPGDVFEQRIDGPSGQLCEGVIRWSEDRKWACSLERVDQTRCLQCGGEGLKRTGRDRRIDNIFCLNVDSHSSPYIVSSSDQIRQRLDLSNLHDRRQRRHGHVTRLKSQDGRTALGHDLDKAWTACLPAAAVL